MLGDRPYVADMKREILDQEGSADLSYDADCGRFRVSAFRQRGGTSFSYDPNGNLASDGVTSYTWNARNQLVGLSGASSASFAYDAIGRRRGKTIGSTTTNFLYDGFNLVQELSGSTPTAYCPPWVARALLIVLLPCTSCRRRAAAEGAEPSPTSR